MKREENQVSKKQKGSWEKQLIGSLKTNKLSE